MNIKKVHVYPNVTWSTLIKNHKYDIAILELEKEVQLTAKVKSFFHLTTPSLTSGASNMSPRQRLLLRSGLRENVLRVVLLVGGGFLLLGGRGENPFGVAVHVINVDDSVT